MSANKPTQPNANALYFGDNPDVLREHVKDEAVDLVYLDPPFNSARDYNILFSSPKGENSEAQITAFKDSWYWGEQAEREFSEIVHGQNTYTAEMIQAMRRFLGENDMMAYLVMMANRLLELHRVLKPTGSLYLHCDPTAGHYLKIVLDTIFGGNFRNEIIWKRTSAHSGAKRYGPVHDILLFYTRGKQFHWNAQYTKYSQEYLDTSFTKQDKHGRCWQSTDLTGNGVRHGDSGKTWRGVDVTAKGRHWAVPHDAIPGMDLSSYNVLERLEKLDASDYIYWPEKKGGVPRLKQYADEMPGVALQSVWMDIPPIGAQSAERLGYPTQKPLALLERIISASSNEGDVVLDPFCGCGTAVHAAQKLKRQWIGIDITHLAITLIEKRLKNAFPEIGFEVHGTPKDLEGAVDLARRDKYQFQWWACSLVNAQPYQGKKKGADGGIDGLIFFLDDTKEHKKIVVSVKGGDNVSVAMVRDLVGVLEREKAEIGLFITLAQPTKAMTTEAVKAGYYTSSVTGKTFRKLQILTIAGLLNGNEKAEYPDLSRGATTFKKAKLEEKTGKQGDLI
ncbi:MAG: restriction endonuclease [Zoogloeaceae bacterium]|jgi:site-specific DNA-methyltransferase (adenine-specific)|nr:restriction endonuclease [Zoogloeaceae bacterium]